MDFLINKLTVSYLLTFAYLSAIRNKFKDAHIGKESLAEEIQSRASKLLFTRKTPLIQSSSNAVS
jgi:hypothetical protein